MDDDTQAVDQSGEEYTPDSTSPVEEERTQPTDDSVSAEKPDKTPEEEGGESEESDVDRNWKAIREENKRLKQELESRQSGKGVLDELRPQYSEAQYARAQESVDINNYVDPTTGQFQAHAYNQAIENALSQRTAQAEAKASQTARQAVDEMIAKQKYPQLDPNSTEYDREFESRVAAQYYFEFAKTGTFPSLQQLAERESQYSSRSAKGVEKRVAQKTKEQLTEKEQAALSAAGRSQPAFASSERLAELQRRTQEGDITATMDRMKKVR